LVKDWSVMDRLSEIHVPTLVMAGRDDFLFPPEHQVELAASLPNARLRIIERRPQRARGAPGRRHRGTSGVHPVAPPRLKIGATWIDGWPRPGRRSRRR
jgi:hypothetical protein